MTGLMALLLTLGLTPLEAHTFAILEEHGRAHEFGCVAEVFHAESSWRPDAIGDKTLGGSYGLPQRHAPAHGMPPWPWPLREQVEWTLEYADDRYGGMCEAAEDRRTKGWW